MFTYRMFIFIRNIIFYVFLCFVYIFPLKSFAINHDWISVPPSKYGEQLWDKQNINTNEDGSIRVLSKFVPKVKNEITKEIFYTMDINCNEKTFRDVAVGADEFDEYQNIAAKWKYPNGDKLILGVIDQVCKIKD
tara:strand:+ start:10073 stop:10477 length:405 start_codon:yes stop_codon:yes gene_type:complete